MTPVIKKRNPELDGAWEEPGVIGERIEIDGGKITVLWRNSPVLETSFKEKKTDAGTELILKKRGMAYSPDSAPYAEVSSLIFSDGALEFTEDFPITGKSVSVLRKTENSRYGKYEIADELLPGLEGTWRDADGYFTLLISGNQISFSRTKRKFHVLRSKGNPSGRYVLADADPSVYGWEGFTRFEYDGSAIYTTMTVCDAPSIGFVFKKV